MVIKQGPGWGLINPQGEEILAPEFDYIGEFKGPATIVILNGKYGLVDRQGYYIWDPIYSQIESLEQGYWMVEKQERWGVINSRSSGWIIEPAYHRIEIIEFPVLQLQQGSNRILAHLKSGNRLEIPFTELTPKNGFYVVSNQDGEGLLSPGLVELFSCDYDDFTIINRVFIGVHRGDTLAIADSNARFLTGFDYRSVNLTDEGDLVLDTKTGRKDLLPQNADLIRPEIAITEFEKLSDRFYGVKAGKTGVMDWSGKLIVPPLYENITLKQDAFFQVKVGHRYGLFNERGEMLFDALYDYISDIEYGRAVVYYKRKVGVIDTAGNVLIPPKFDYLENSQDQIKAYQGRNIHLFPLTSGGRISEELVFTNVKTIRVRISEDAGYERYDPQELDSVSNWMYDSEKGGWGLKNEKDSLVIPHQYAEITILNEVVTKTALFRSYNHSYWDFFKHHNLMITRAFGMVNHQAGGVLVPNVYWDIRDQDYDSALVARVVLEGGRQGLLHRKGKTLIEFKDGTGPRAKIQPITYVGPFSEGLARICLGGNFRYNGSFDQIQVQGGKWGYIDLRGSLVLQPRYELALDFESERAIVKQNGKYGLIDRQGKLIIPFEYDSIIHQESGADDLFKLIRNAPRQGLISRLGVWSVLPEYDEIHSFSEGFSRVKSDGKWGYLDLHGKWGIAPRFSEARDFSEGLAAVKINGRWGFINTAGRMVVAPKFRQAWSFSQGIGRVRLGRTRFGYLASDGKLLFNQRFRHTGAFNRGLAIARSKKTGVINETGAWVIKPKYTRVKIDYGEDLILAKRKS